MMTHHRTYGVSQGLRSVWNDLGRYLYRSARGAQVKLGRTASQERGETTQTSKQIGHSFEHGHGNVEISHLLEPTVMKLR